MHKYYLLQALELAKTRQGFCAPNPAVGAVLVKDNHIIETGVHQGLGYPHAEADLFSKLDEDLQNATLYITLEPCCHFGRTPPCTDLILKRGIEKVYYAYEDPHPYVSGQGATLLSQAGVDCKQIEVSEITHFYQSYTHWVNTQLPYITAKIALSLDGKIAAENGASVLITGKEVKKYTHQWRYKSDAILTTSRTILNDDPQLNVRLDGQSIAKPIYVLDSLLTFPSRAKLLDTAKKIILFHQQNISYDRIQKLKEIGIECVAVSHDETGLNLHEVVSKIGKDGIHDLWVEAGGKCFSNMLKQKLVDQALIYVAPKILGEKAYQAFSGKEDFLDNAKEIHWKNCGRDVICELKF